MDSPAGRDSRRRERWPIPGGIVRCRSGSPHGDGRGSQDTAVIIPTVTATRALLDS